MLLLVVLAISAFTDWMHRKIYNVTIYPALAIVMLLYCVPWGSDFREPIIGTTYLSDAIIGGIVCFFVMMTLWLTNGIGGGDVKVSGLIGLCLGLSAAFTVILLAFMLASVGLLIDKIALKIKKTFRSRSVRNDDLSAESNIEKGVPLGPYFALSYLLLLTITIVGR